MRRLIDDPLRGAQLPASCCLQSTTPSVLTPPIWENQNISSEVFLTSLETWEWEVDLTTNRRNSSSLSLCVFQAQISLDTMWRRLISACFSNTLEFKLSNFQNRGCVATSYNETLRNKLKEKVWRQWIELIMLLVTEGTFNVLYLINRIPWRDLASVTINRHTRLDLIVAGSSEKSFFDCLCHFSFVLWVELRERSRKPLLCSLRENKNHRWKKHLSWFRSISRSSLRVKQLGRPFPHRSPRYDFDWHGIPFAYTN